MVPLELFGQPWVLFRDAAGAPACVADACAHRACPLSLVRVTGAPRQNFPVIL
jgi:chlorophyllide a oxygenase